jgi:hypothetical protein
MTRNELLTSLREQVQFIDTSCREFDTGNLTEAKRLAVTVRTLLHETPRSKSLVGKLAKLQTFLMFDMAIIDIPENVVPYHGLTSYRIGPNGISYWPHCLSSTGCADERRFKSFQRWWNTKVIDDRQGHTLSRKDIVLNLANKEGGAHLDPELPKGYKAISRENSIGISGGQVGKSEPIQNTISACMRQIAEEVRLSLLRKFASLNKNLLYRSMIAKYSFNMNPLQGLIMYKLHFSKAVYGRIDLLHWTMRVESPPIFGRHCKIVMATDSFIWYSKTYRKKR